MTNTTVTAVLMYCKGHILNG